MIRLYGLFGIFMVLFVELNYFLKIEPFAKWYFPIVWFGYIFVIDSINKKLKGKSLISDRLNVFFLMLVISAVVWWTFEIYNLRIGNWFYEFSGWAGLAPNVIKKTLSFATVIPAIFETYSLIRNVHLFDNIRFRRKHKITKTLINAMFILGVLCFVLPLIWPRYFFPLIWLAFFFLLDPLNYIHKQPSIIKHLKDRKLVVPLSILLAGIVCGFLWEFWNYWSVAKWTYDVPFVGFFKIFEMPVLGYLGYFPFALEIYAMYYYLQSLFFKTSKPF